MNSANAFLSQCHVVFKMLIIGLAVQLATTTPAAAQTIQPTAEQIRMLNQLPPEQRRQALDVLRDYQSRQRAQTQSAESVSDSANSEESLNSRREVRRDTDTGELRAKAGTSLVITMTATEDADPQQVAEIESDPALRQIRGSNFYELDESGVLHLPGLHDIPLLGLSVDAIEKRLGAEPALALFNVEVNILSAGSIGKSDLEPFGYDLFDGDDEMFREGGSDTTISGPVPSDYPLGPGDVVKLQLFGNVNNSYELEVSRDGVLNVPELGPMNIAGLRFSTFRTEMEQRVQDMLIGTRVSVSMGNLRSIRVFVVGDVNYPGSYVVSSLSTISSALYRSGGISPVGSLRDVQLKRQGEIVTRLDLYDLLLHGDTSDDEQLQQGDVIFIPPIGTTIGVSGAVRRPAIYESRAQLSLAQALSLAGGLAPDAFPSASTLERYSRDRERTTLSVDLGSVTDGALPVHDGDILTIPQVLQELTRSVVLLGHVQRPGPREWREGMRITDLIPSLDLLSPGADADYVLIRREVMPDRRIQILSADLSAALTNPTSDENIQLKARDTVHVFDLAFGRQRVIEPILEELRIHADIDSPYEEVRIAGSVLAPGKYPLEEGMRISDLVRAGGNLAEGAYTEVAELTHFTIANGQTRRKEVFEVDLESALHGDESANLLLSPYDHLRISRVPNWSSDWAVTIEGEVRFPGRYQILRGETLASVLNRAGGLTEQAFPEGAIFLREALKEREREQLDKLARRIESELTANSLESLDSGGSEALTVGQNLLRQIRETQPVGRLVIDLEQVIAAGPKPKSTAAVELKDGDHLLVPGSSQEVTVLGEAQYPTSHLYREGLTRDDYISLSGGLTRKADKNLIYVVRASGAVVSSNRSNWFHRGENAVIRPGDTIVIPVETDSIRPLTFWTNVSQIFYQSAIAVAAIRTFNN